MSEVGDFIRDSLMQLNIGDTVNFPLTQKSSIGLQMQDLNMFGYRRFTSKTDKTRHEIIVKRVT